MVGISEWTKTNEGLRQRLNVAIGQRRQQRVHIRYQRPVSSA